MRSNAEAIRCFIVHWNRPEECLATVRRLLGQGVEMSITILDNASTREARESIRAQLDPAIEIIQLEDNGGWGPALNIGLTHWLKAETHSFCLIGAHDAEPAEGCVGLLLEAMKREPRLGIVCPQYPDASVPHFGCIRGVSQDRGIPLGQGVLQIVDVPHGTLFLVRRECLAQIGLFDERYFAYGDEHELGLRAKRCGWQTALVWGALVSNRGTWTPSELRSYLFTRNSLLLVHDYCGRLCAWTRAALILLNTLRLMIISPGEGFAFSPSARWRGVRDYFAARFGGPTQRWSF
jgi:N-acetylglucosaminyl-diphospho-decaprenol L-rhamnosyltransferase